LSYEQHSVSERICKGIQGPLRGDPEGGGRSARWVGDFSGTKDDTKRFGGGYRKRLDCGSHTKS